MTLSTDVQEKVESLKAQGYSVFAITISGVKYIYRSINRKEYRDIQDLLAKLAKAEEEKKLPEDKLEEAALNIRDKGEEQIVKVGLVHPEIHDNAPAGILTTLSDRIMEASGFGIEVEPEIL